MESSNRPVAVAGSAGGPRSRRRMARRPRRRTGCIGSRRPAAAAAASGAPALPHPALLLPLLLLSLTPGSRPVPPFSAAAASAPGASYRSSSAYDPSDAMEASRYGTLPPTVFAPTGRLRMVERAAAASSDASDLSASTVVALRCGGGVVGGGGEFVAIAFAGPRSPHAYYGPTEEDEKDEDEGGGGGNVDAGDGDGAGGGFRSPLLIDEGADGDGGDGEGIIPPAPVSILSPALVAAAAGGAVDSAVLLRRVQDAAFGLHGSGDGGAAAELYGGGAAGLSSVRASDLARRMADAAQVPTQTVGSSAGRILSSVALVVGTDEGGSGGGRRCRIWRVDPTGQFWDCDAAAAGRGAGSAEAALLRGAARWKEGRGEGGQSDADNDGPSAEGSLGMDRILETVSNEDVGTYLATLSADEAVGIAFRCLAEGRQMKEADYTSGEDADAGARYVGVRGMILWPGSNRGGSGGRPRVELLSWKNLRQWLSQAESI